MSRLVHGLPPVGLKSSQAFQAEIRLFSVIEEEYLVGMTLSSNTTAVVPLPLPSNLKLQYATNMDLLGGTKEFMRLRERCESLSTHLEDRIVIHDIVLPKDLRINGADLKQKINIHHKQGSPTSNLPYSHRPYNNPSDDYDEIEQIYDYVRGFAPLPKTARGWRYEPTPGASSSPAKVLQSVSNTDESANSSDMTPPEPPPLETLPSRMMHKSDLFSPPPWGMSNMNNYSHIKNYEQVYEPPTGPTKASEAKKRQRHSATEKASKQIENVTPVTTVPRFIKSANYKSMQSSQSASNQNPTQSTYRQRLFRSNRSNNNNKEAHTNYGPTTGPSMFQMRYKSMTNLAQFNSSPASNEYDTLNSSNSGGKTSGGSSSTRQPEKRSRRLSRPKSLTNLVWGSREKSASRQSLNAPDLDPMRRLEPGVFGGTVGNRRLEYASNTSPHHHVFANGKKLGGSKKIGTLYL